MRSKIITNTLLRSLLFKGDYFLNIEKMRIVSKKSRNQFYQSFGNADEFVRKIIYEYCSTHLKRKLNEENGNYDKFLYLAKAFINDFINYPRTFIYLVKSEKILHFRFLLKQELIAYLVNQKILQDKSLFLYFEKVFEYHLNHIINLKKVVVQKSNAKNLINLEINQLIDELYFNKKRLG